MAQLDWKTLGQMLAYQMTHEAFSTIFDVH